MIGVLDDALPAPSWLARLYDEPEAGIDRLLRGSVFFGNLNARDPAEVLIQWTADGEEGLVDLRRTIDAALQGWCARHWGKLEGFRSTVQAAVAWQRAFEIVAHSYDFETTLTWMRRKTDAHSFLRQLATGPDMDPLEAYFFALALHQEDDSLGGTWWSMCELAGDTPYYYGVVGLNGIRYLPSEANGVFRGEVARALLLFIIAIEGLVNGGLIPKKFAEREVVANGRQLFSAFPFPARWRVELQNAVGDLQSQVPDQAATWIRKIFPFLSELSGREVSAGLFDKPLQAHLDQLLKGDPDLVIEQSNDYLRSQEVLASRNGRTRDLVFSLTYLSERVRKRSPKAALDWADSARRWRKDSPHAWTALAKAYQASGDSLRALAVSWEMRERFPENAVVWSVLAAILRDNHFHREEEAILRLEIELFPENPRTFINLSEALRLRGRIDDSIAVLKRGITQHPNLGQIHRFLGAALKWSGPAAWDDAAKALDLARATGDITAAEAEMESLYGLRARVQHGESWEKIATTAIGAPIEQEESLMAYLSSQDASPEVQGMWIRWLRVLRKLLAMGIVDENQSTYDSAVEGLLNDPYNRRFPDWQAEGILYLLDAGRTDEAIDRQEELVPTGAPLMYALARSVRDKRRTDPVNLTQLTLRDVQTVWDRLADFNHNFSGVTLLGYARTVPYLTDGDDARSLQEKAAMRLARWAAQTSRQGKSEFDRWWSTKVTETIGPAATSDDVEAVAHAFESNASRLNQLEEVAITRASN